MAKPKQDRRQAHIDPEQWQDMLMVYRQQGTEAALCREFQVSRRIATRAVNEGWPAQSLPPFRELLKNAKPRKKVSRKPSAEAKPVIPPGLVAAAPPKTPTQALLPQPTFGALAPSAEEDGLQRMAWEDVLGDPSTLQHAGKEALASRLAMNGAMQSAQLTQGYATTLLRSLENGTVPMPEDITPQLIQKLVRSIESYNKVIREAIRIGRMQSGTIEDNSGAQLGAILDGCTDEELEFVLVEGILPARLTDNVPQALPPAEDDDLVDDFIDPDSDKPTKFDEDRELRQELAAIDAELAELDKLDQEELEEDFADSPDTEDEDEDEDIEGNLAGELN